VAENSYLFLCEVLSWPLDIWLTVVPGDREIYGEGRITQTDRLTEKRTTGGGEKTEGEEMERGGGRGGTG
jgi:hypothetical protein